MNKEINKESKSTTLAFYRPEHAAKTDNKYAAVTEDEFNALVHIRDYTNVNLKELVGQTLRAIVQITETDNSYILDNTSSKLINATENITLTDYTETSGAAPQMLLVQFHNARHTSNSLSRKSVQHKWFEACSKIRYEYVKHSPDFNLQDIISEALIRVYLYVQTGNEDMLKAYKRVIHKHSDRLVDSKTV